jgi:hypothetical protein
MKCKLLFADFNEKLNVSKTPQLSNLINKIRSAALELFHVGRRRVVGKAHFRTLIANFLK